MPMKLNDISDKSEYSIDNRQFYSQSYNITVKAYIITQDSLVVEERPEMKFLGLEGDSVKHSYAEVEELPCDYKKESDGQYHVYAGTFNNKANYDKVVAKLNAAGIKTTQK